MSEATILNLPYHNQLVDYYQKLSNLPGFVLLESRDKTRGRYDILSAYPYEQISLKAPVVQADIFTQLQACIPATPSQADLPFQGGAIGYFSYDLGAQLAGIASTPQPILSGMPLIDIGLYDWAIISDHLLKRVVLFAANRCRETSTQVAKVMSLWHKEEQTKTKFNIIKRFTPLINKARYQQAFAAIYQYLQQGRAYQVNYTQAFQGAYQGDPWQMFKQVGARNPVPYAAFLRTRFAAVLSFSPERFLSMDNDQLLTSPIKGTARRVVDPRADSLLAEKLSSCSKNRAENTMIVDLMRNDLGKIARPGSVQVSALCQLQSFQGVHHLISDIKALRCERLTPFEVFGACFPGGSITGAPKREAMRIIAEQELHGRGVYCGSIGYFSRHGRFDSNIAIRTITARQGILHLAAGGGIVIDSHWEEEYDECFAKIAAIAKGMQ